MYRRTVLSTDVAHGACTVRTRPKRRQAASEFGELLPQGVTGGAFEPAGDFSDRPARIELNEHVYVVGHHFERVNRQLQVGGDLVEQCAKPYLARCSRPHPGA